MIANERWMDVKLSNMSSSITSPTESQWIHKSYQPKFQIQNVGQKMYQSSYSEQTLNHNTRNNVHIWQSQVLYKGA